jgi:hypothetical protein
VAASDLLLTGPVGNTLGWVRKQMPKSMGGESDAEPVRTPPPADTGSRRAPVARPREAKDPAQNFARGGPALPRTGIQGSKLWRG